MAVTIDQIRKVFSTYFTPDYTGQLDANKIKKILEMYSSKEGGRTYIGNKLKVDQTVVGRVLKIAEENNLVKKVLPSEFKTKEAQRIYKDISERKIY